MLSNILVSLVLLLQGCSEHNENAREYFQEVTGLEICASSNIIDLGVTNYNYKFKIHSTPDCKKNVFEIIRTFKEHNCARDKCYGFDNESNYYYAEKINENEILFSYQPISG